MQRLFSEAEYEARLAQAIAEGSSLRDQYLKLTRTCI